MKKTVKSLVAIFAVAIIGITSAITVFASVNIPDATTDLYVNDFAEIFSEEEKSRLMNNAVSLANENDGIQVVVTTIKSLDGATVEDYAYDMYNKYGIGKDDMGLLIFLATEDRKIRVEVGKAMEAYVNDAKAGRFMDKHAIPYLKENKFNEGLINLQEALIAEVKTRVAAETSNSGEKNNETPIDWSSVLLVLGVILIAGVIVFVIVVIVKKAKSKKEYIQGLESEIESLKKSNSMMQQVNESHIASLKTVNSELLGQKNQFEMEIKHLLEEIDNLKDRHKRLLKIYPEADKKVDDAIKAEQIERDMQEAKRVDDLIAAVINKVPSKDIVSDLSTVLSAYSSLTENQKQHVKSDVKKLQDIYNSSLKLLQVYERLLEEERIRKLTEKRKNEANAVNKAILAVISAIGVAKASDLAKLRDAKELYENLDRETQKYVDNTIISRLNNLLAASKRAKDKQEAEEHRRRQSSYHSSTSFGGGSSSFRGGGFGGFGGRTGGGGASRGF